MTLEEFRTLKVGDYLFYKQFNFIMFLKIKSIDKIINSYNHICYCDIIYRNSAVTNTNKSYCITWYNYFAAKYTLVTDQKEIDYYYKLAIFS